MIKKLLTIGALIAGIVLLLTTTAWFLTPLGFSKIGFGNYGAWNALSWSGMLFSGLARLIIWISPVMLVACLVSSLLQPAAPQEVEQSNQGGKS